MARMLLLLAAALCLAVTHALYADQAGEFDWSAQNVGRAQAVAFGGSVSRGPHSVVSRGATRAVYVASDAQSRALARLDAKTGEIQWRRVFPEGTGDIKHILGRSRTKGKMLICFWLL
jgi:outer membrane protein assembly factor BamB